jgi:thioredoxin reductase (NADPH)
VNITAQELIDSLYSQAQAYSPTVLLDTFVEDIVPCQTPDNITLHQQINDNKTITPHVNTASQNNSEASVAQNNNPQNVQQERLFNILTAQGNYFAHNVIIATGGGRFQPNKPTIENLDEFESAHIHYCVKDPQRFAGKKVVITGGGDAAVDWAMELLPIAASVSIVHRRSSFRAKNEANLKEYENAGKITIYRDRCVKELTGTDGILRSVKVASTNEKVPADDIDIDADDLLVFFGLSVSSCSNWGLETKRGKIVVNPSTCETSIPGIFAIGDAISRESNVYMVVPGFADALAVAHMIKSNNKFSDR